MIQMPRIMLVDPAWFSVSYVINPWMNPAVWAENPELHRRRARSSFASLCEALQACGATLEVVAGAEGLPDMVFPANAAVILDGRAIVARFACAERRGEEPVFLKALQGFMAKGLLSEVATMPERCFQEGAGDAIWDSVRQVFWAGHGQRSILRATHELGAFFERTVVPLELASPQFYHLDTCFCPLSGGEVIYYPAAFTPAALAAIHEHVAPAQRLEANLDDARAFCVNAVNLGRSVIMARATGHVRGLLGDHGYAVHEVDLDPFILSGGGAYCMTLRLDRSSG